MADPTRPLPNLIPQPDGSWTGRTVLTPTAFKTRGLFMLPPSKVVPVIVVPGVMGTNLRAKKKPGKHPNGKLNAGEEAWRPPNGKIEGLTAAYMWHDRKARERQLILDSETLEVDTDGEINLPLDARNYGMSVKEVHDFFSWGEVHWDSYGDLLYGLHVRLNHTFEMSPLDNVRTVCQHWKDVMGCDPGRWGVRKIERITEKEFEKHARYYYPVYAFGYNWLASCEESAKHLHERIERIIDFWTSHRRECKKVILVTHSMGGLVARACASRIPERILGVIHGVMPALGAPACYRRIACGTESSSPGDGPVDRTKAVLTSEILGNRPELTMPVMATSPGPLELLPNHLYPQPWLHLDIRSRVNHKDVTRDLADLPLGNPYDLYRDTKSWYRLIDLQLADPAKKYKGEFGLKDTIRKAIDNAEKFHRKTLDTRYHPNTYAFYGADPAHMSFGSVHWEAFDRGTGAVFTGANLRAATLKEYCGTGGRRVRVEGKTELDFEPGLQDVGGDGTVPPESGAGPRGKVRQLFEMRGLDHQEAFNDEAVLLLSQYLVVKMVQELP